MRCPSGTVGYRGYITNASLTDEGDIRVQIGQFLLQFRAKRTGRTWRECEIECMTCRSLLEKVDPKVILAARDFAQKYWIDVYKTGCRLRRAFLASQQRALQNVRQEDMLEDARRHEERYAYIR